jgi:chemotaxis protein MotB
VNGSRELGAIAVSTKGKPKDQKQLAPIIKKKVHAEEEGHHGGVWKIAYADFMTAMMTFFLVMWLINSASKEKIIQIANYFNPVKLSDRTPPTKGVQETPKSGPDKESATPEKNTKEKDKEKEKENKQPGQKPATPPKHEEEEALFRNPFGVLTQIALQAEGPIGATSPQAGQEKLASGGSSHDPFVTDPIMSQIVNHTAGVGEHQGTGQEAPLPKSEASKDQNAADAKAEAAAAEKQAKEGGEKPIKPETLEKAIQLEKELGRLLGALPEAFRPGVSTKATGEGVLVSLTDNANFNMFRISSSEPSPQLVVFLEKAGGLITKYPGRIVIRGHTDGRPYAGDSYGNWRLSVNRATIIYYMLLRGKVDDKRFLALEGYADRNLKNKTDPLSGENRRIEILIKSPEG